MANENTSTQPPAVPPAPPAGPSVEELQAKAAELEKAREGLIRDLQEERRKRQEAELRLSTPAVPSTDQKQDVGEDELYKVIAPVLEKHPLAKKIREMEVRESEERAKAFLTAKTGKKWEDIEGDKTLQEKLLSITSRFKLSGSPDDVVKRAYDIYELEEVKQREAERERAAKASANSSMPSGAPPAPVSSNKEFTVADFTSMSPSQYADLAGKGSFKKVGDKFVYTPK